MGVAARRQREKEERRAAILAAAEKVFVGKGVSMATMDDIAHEAELSKGTLYLYFDSKDELYLEIAVRAVGDLLAAFEHAAASGNSGYEKLAGIAHAYTTFGTQESDRFRVAVGWLTSDPGAAGSGERFNEFKRIIAQIYQVTERAIELGKQDGTLRSDLDTPTLFAQLWGASLGVLTLQLNATQVMRRMPDEVQLENIVPSFVDLILQAIRADGTTGAVEVRQSSPQPEVA